MKHLRLRIALLIVISASLGIVVYKVTERIWLMKAREFEKNPLKLLDYAPEAALEIKEFRRAKVEGGKKVWEIFGDEARYFKAEKEVTIKKPRIVIYQKDNSVVEATSSEGHLWLSDEDREMEKMQLKGKAQVTYRGFILHTEEMFYYKEKDQLIIPGRVIIKGEGQELEGERMEMSLKSEKMRLHKNVKTRIQPDQLEKISRQPNGKNEG